MTIYNNYDIAEDIEADYEADYLDNILYILSKQAQFFVMTGTCGTWHGRVKGGVILNELAVSTLSRYLYDYTKIELLNGKIEITTQHHDGTNYYTIKPLSCVGQKYYLANCMTKSREELCEKLANTNGLTKKFKSKGVL